MIEVWKDIEGYEGMYQISNLGNVKSLDRIDSGGNRRKGKIMSQSTAKNGYKVVTLTKNAKEKMFKIHRLVCIAFIPNTENKPQVNHINGDKANNNVTNLEWCTGSENMVHAYKTGLEIAPKGKEHHMYNKTGSQNPNYGNRGSKNSISIKVRCITTGKEFDCIREASEFYNVDPSGISGHLKNNKPKSAGKDPITGEKLVWEYI